MIFFFLVLLHLCHCFIMEYVICMISSKLIVYMRSSMSKWPPNGEIGIDCNKTSVRLRPLTMKPVAPRRAGAQLRSDTGGGNMWAHRVTVLSPHNPGKTFNNIGSEGAVGKIFFVKKYLITSLVFKLQKWFIWFRYIQLCFNKHMESHREYCIPLLMKFVVHQHA